MVEIKLRHAISVVVFKEGKFLMVAGKDWPEGSWCFPQGGIKDGEQPIDTVKRELKEELGTDKFKIHGKSKIDHTYYFPEKLKLKKGFDGQYQTIWFAEFLGNHDEIKQNQNELMNLSWFNKENIVPNMMYPEQKETFSKVLEEFDEDIK